MDPMTGRERLTNILAGQPNERLVWTTLVDDVTRSVMPPEVRRLHVLDFYRHVGCDILQFGDYGLPAEDRPISPAALRQPVRTVRSESDGLVTRATVSQWGELTASWRSGHPVTYPVETLADLEVLTRIWAHSRYEEVQDSRPEESLRRVEERIGDDGLYVATTAPSPVQQLIEGDLGLERFCYFLQDHPRQMEELLAAMHRCRVQEYEILARRTAAPAIVPVENTSSTLTSPSMYRQLSLPQIAEYARIVHKHGRKFILHMCGLLKGLLPVLKETHLDGINGLTPPTVGDTPYEAALDALGEGLILLGAGFPGQVFQKPGATAGEIQSTLDSLDTPRLRRARLLLWMGADGLPTPLERFLAVREWMDRHGGPTTQTGS